MAAIIFDMYFMILYLNKSLLIISFIFNFILLIMFLSLYLTSLSFSLNKMQMLLLLISINYLSLISFGVPLSGTTMMLISSLILWLSINIMSIIFNVKYLLANLCPPSSPNILAPILVLIEMSSSLARPVSLSVRIIANISCSHLLLFLCGNLILIMFSLMNLNVFNYMLLYFMVMLSYITLFTFTAFESSVMLIQGYVYSTLMDIYSSDMSL